MRIRLLSSVRARLLAFLLPASLLSLGLIAYNAWRTFDAQRAKVLADAERVVNGFRQPGASDGQGAQSARGAGALSRRRRDGTDELRCFTDRLDAGLSGISQRRPSRPTTISSASIPPSLRSILGCRSRRRTAPGAAWPSSPWTSWRRTVRRRRLAGATTAAKPAAGAAAPAGMSAPPKAATPGLSSAEP